MPNLQIVYDFLVKGRGDLQAARKEIAAIVQESERARSGIDGMKRSMGRPAAFSPVGSSSLVGISGVDNRQKNINDLRREISERQRLNGTIRETGKGFGEADKAQSSVFSSGASGLAQNIVGWGALTAAVYRGATAIKDFTIGSALAAAEADLQSVALAHLARANNQSVVGVQVLEKRLQSLGISIRESRAQLARLVTSDIPVSKAPAIADLARNLSVTVPGETTSSTFAAVVNSVISGEVEPLRRRGLSVNFEQAIQRAARTAGKSSTDFSEAEKALIRLQHTLDVGARSAGVYEKSLETAGKQITSLPRLVDDLKVKLGSEFQNELGATTKLVTALVQELQDLTPFIGISVRGALSGNILRGLPRTGGSPEGVFLRGARASVAGATSVFKGEAEDRNAQIIAGNEVRRLKFLEDIEKALKVVISLEDQATLSRLKGLERINAEQEIFLRNLAVRTPELTARVTAAFNQKRADGSRDAIQGVQRAAARDVDDVVARLGLRPEPFDPAASLERQTTLFQKGLGDRVSTDEKKLSDDERALETFKTSQARHRISLVSLETRHRERLISLSTDEIGQGQALSKLRVDAAQRVFAITKDEFQLHEDLTAARLDGELLIAEIRRKQLDDYRESAGRVFDALIARGGGFREFLKGQALTTGRTVFQNVAGEVFNASRGRAQLPGQTTTDAQGNPKLTALGRILQNTPLGADPGKFALESNTTALQRLTSSVDALRTGALSASGAGGALGALAGQFPLGRDIEKSIELFGKIPGLDKLGKGADASKDAASASKEVSKGLSKFLEFGVPLGVGGFGIASGIRQGGAGGKLGIAGGALTASSAIPGPQAPFLAAGGQVLSLIGSLFGDSKQNRQEEIQAELDRRRFQSPGARDFTEFSGGFETDLNFYRGAPRITNIYPVANVNINAIDSKSFSDHSQEIAGAVSKAIMEGSDLSHTITERFLPA